MPWIGDGQAVEIGKTSRRGTRGAKRRPRCGSLDATAQSREFISISMPAPPQRLTPLAVWSSSVLDSLPDRALTNDEAERLKTQNPGVVPLSILKGKETPFVVYALAYYLRTSGEVHLLGYSEDDGGWVTIETFPEDEWSVDSQERVIQEWIDARYGEEFEQGILDEDSGTVRMGKQ